MNRVEPSEAYRNAFYGEVSRDIMTRGRILAPGAHPRSLVEGLLARIERAEAQMGEPNEDTRRLLNQFHAYIDDGVCILGSPLLTNISADRPTLASCTAVPLKPGALCDGLHSAEQYYKLNMGSGYNLDDYRNPVEVLLALNRHASSLETTQACERYIGNIAHVSISHPCVRDFIAAKRIHKGVKHFNISVDVSDSFMDAVEQDGGFTLDNGIMVSARDLWSDLVYCAWLCGDPGVISLARFNADNPVAGVSPYLTTAPCAEVGLSRGESCVFGYINLAACLRWVGGQLDLDYKLIGNVAQCLTRVLDDCLETSLTHFPTEASNSVMSLNRKIAIGVCGFADALIWLGLDYGSSESCDLIRRALSAINFRSKHASMLLAARRGAFPQFPFSRYVANQGFAARFASASIGVEAEAWHDLAADISRHGIRNAITTALPPSGRSSLLLGTSASIEPILYGDGHAIPPAPDQALFLGGFLGVREKDATLIQESGDDRLGPRKISPADSLFRDARQLSVAEHLAVLSAASALVDDGVSKTVNLPNHARPSDVDEVFRRAWSGGLKAISVYRDCSMGEMARGEESVALPSRHAPGQCGQMKGELCA